MSETDDTDLLLLIPPNFFSIMASDFVNSTKNTRDSIPLVETVRNGISLNNENSAKKDIGRSKDYFADVDLSKSADEFETKTFRKQTGISEQFKNSNIVDESLTSNKFSDCLKESSIHHVNQNSFLNNIGNTFKNLHLTDINLPQIDYMIKNVENIRNNIVSELNVHFDKENKNTVNNTEEQSKILNIINETNKFISGSNVNVPIIHEQCLNRINHNFTLSESGDSIKLRNVNDKLYSENEKVNSKQSSLQDNYIVNDSNISRITQNNCSHMKTSSEDNFLPMQEGNDRLVQQLQSKVLELEQRLSSTINLDVEKDEIINVLTRAWMKLTHHWKQLEDQRYNLALLAEQERTKFRQSSTEYTEKINELESKLANVMLLVSDYKKLSERNEGRTLQANEQIRLINEKFELQISDLNNTVEKLKAEKQELLNKLANEEMRAIANGKIDNLNRQNLVPAEHLQTEQSKVTLLTKQNALLMNMLDEARKSEELMKKELDGTRENMSKLKDTLKEYYQTQLKHTIKSKMEELQQQLDKAETIVHNEQQRREKTINDEFENKIHLMQIFHKTELKRLKKKYDDVTTQLKNIVREKEQKIALLERNFKSNKLQLAKQLQKIMENQWLEVLNVIRSEEYFDATNLSSFNLEINEAKIQLNNDTDNVYDTTANDKHEETLNNVQHRI